MPWSVECWKWCGQQICEIYDIGTYHQLENAAAFAKFPITSALKDARRRAFQKFDSHLICLNVILPRLGSVCHVAIFHNVPSHNI